MVSLRIMSWNLRTFAMFTPQSEDYRRMADIILNSRADIVCIQEVQIGAGVGPEIDSPISQGSQQIVANLATAVANGDPHAQWQHAVSGVNQGVTDKMRDAYAFLWKSEPSASQFAHASPVAGITSLGGPVILRQLLGSDHFPGRRPGMLAVLVTDPSTTAPIDIISYHARTPANGFSKGNGAGYGINALSSLPEVGGGRIVSNGWQYKFAVTRDDWALPQVDTVVLGDFNYSMDQPKARLVYTNLLRYYEPCVSSPDDVTFTTYAPSGTQALRLVSAYDNIFVLKSHDGFKPALSYANAHEAIDFIAADAQRLGQAIDIRNADAATATMAAWFVVHKDQYKRQKAVRGISDHLPVWADFTVAATDTTASHIKPTAAGADGLLHAVFGVQAADGRYTDGSAAQRRVQVATMLRSYGTGNPLPTTGNAVPVRKAVLQAMRATLTANPTATTLLDALLQNTADPFADSNFPALYTSFVNGISPTGRAFASSDVDLIADLLKVTINERSIGGGQYWSTNHNPGASTPKSVVRLGGNYYRWA